MKMTSRSLERTRSRGLFSTRASYQVAGPRGHLANRRRKRKVSRFPFVS
jgi:hypothetical protein